MSIRERVAEFDSLTRAHPDERYLCLGVAADRHALLVAGDALADNLRVIHDINPAPRVRGPRLHVPRRGRPRRVGSGGGMTPQLLEIVVDARSAAEAQEAAVKWARAEPKIVLVRLTRVRPAVMSTGAPWPDHWTVEIAFTAVESDQLQAGL